LCAVALLSAAFMRLRPTWKHFLGALHPFSLGLPLFSSEVFLMKPFTFFVFAYFFIGDLFEEPLYDFVVASFFIEGIL
jgi:hypothetical protein